MGNDAPPEDVVQVMTWNVQHASAQRGLRQADWLACRPESDVIALTEVSGGPAGEHLAQALAGHGYQTVLTPSWQKDYRVLLGTRIGKLEPRVVALPERSHRLAVATIVLPGGRTFGFVGMYVPSRGPQSQRNVAKRAFQTAVTNILPNFPAMFGSTTPVIIAGDLNVVEPEHLPAHAVFGKWEYDFYRAFQDAGFVDAFRHRNHDVIDHSWFGRSGAGYRFDHLFYSASHVPGLRDCRYVHEPRLNRLSDHAALTARIEFHEQT